MITLRVLGSVDLRKEDGQSVHTLLAQPKRMALLALLCARSGEEFIRRDVVASLFWPERDHEHARAGLRTGLHALRRTLGEVIATRGNDEIAIVPDAISCDAVAFEHACEAEQWKQALDLYHGDFLAGMHVQDPSVELERWIEQQRERYRQMATHAVWQLSGAEERKGNLSEALKLARRAMGWNTTDEVGARRLILLHEALGNRTGAIAAFDAFKRTLHEELEVEPSTEMLELIEALRGGRRPFPASPSAVLAMPPVPLMLIPIARVRRWAVAGSAVAVVLVLLGSAWSLSLRAHSTLPAAPVSGTVSELATSVRGFLQVAGMPTPLSHTSAVYDAAHDKVYVFGGYNGRDHTNEVWAMDDPGQVGSVTWTRLEPGGIRPQPRHIHAAVYDSAGAQMIVFGGGLGFTSPCANDVWLLKNPSRRNRPLEWIELKPDGALPDPRGDHGAVWLPGNRRMIVFGGHDCIAQRKNDTWVLDLSDVVRPRWQRLAVTSPAPAPRGNHSLVYDAAGDRVLLFGGGSDAVRFNDVWELAPASTDAAGWRPLRTLGTRPPEVHLHRAAWDPLGRQMIVFGGNDASGVPSNRTWLMRDAGGGVVRWRRLDGLPKLPPGRWAHGMAYNSALDELIVVGGQTPGALLYDAWVLMNATQRKTTRAGR